MKRFAFKMQLKPGCEKEYEKRHAAIWPELVKMIKDGGVSNYSIYWDKETNILFGYQECAGEGRSSAAWPYCAQPPRRCSTAAESA